MESSGLEWEMESNFLLLFLCLIHSFYDLLQADWIANAKPLPNVLVCLVQLAVGQILTRLGSLIYVPLLIVFTIQQLGQGFLYPARLCVPNTMDLGLLVSIGKENNAGLSTIVR